MASPSQQPPEQRLLLLIKDALDVARKAKRHRNRLDGANFYAAKMTNIRADAANLFSRLANRSVGDTSALAELMQQVFSADSTASQRARAASELEFRIRTELPGPPPDAELLEENGVFPLIILSETGRAYLVSVGRQVNGCYAQGWYDACAVMMRRLLESVIIEAFEGKGADTKIKNPKTGDFFPLTELINAALAESSWNLPRSVRMKIADLGSMGHRSAHNRYFLARKPDIDRHSGPYRETIETFLHLAGLL